VLQCVAVCCSVLQFVNPQSVAIECCVCGSTECGSTEWVAVCRSVLQCGAVRCSVLQCVVGLGCGFIHKRKSSQTKMPSFRIEFANADAVMPHTHTHTHTYSFEQICRFPHKRDSKRGCHHVTYKKRVVIYLNESCHTSLGSSNNISQNFEVVTSQVNAACHTCTRHVTYESGMSLMNTSCHIRMSHVTYTWVMAHTHQVCHV